MLSQIQLITLREIFKVLLMGVGVTGVSRIAYFHSHAMYERVREWTQAFMVLAKIHLKKKRVANFQNKCKFADSQPLRPSPQNSISLIKI